jgi:O-antigen chain-terminating methyltransferase
LQKIGFKSTGADIDKGMLEICRLNNLNVIEKDFLDFIKSIDSSSQMIVSAFHVIEHISFEKLRLLVNEAVRVLKPGGVLILETPNPENISVATNKFYLDPTPKRPIPPELLDFVVGFAGFQHTRIVRLQQPIDILTREKISLADVVNSVSPDYAVIAQKGGGSDVFDKTSKFFTQTYGATLNDIILKFDNRIDFLENKYSLVLMRAQEIEAKVISLEAEYNFLTGEIRLIKSSIYSKFIKLFNRIFYRK